MELIRREKTNIELNKNECNVIIIKPVGRFLNFFGGVKERIFFPTIKN